MCEGRAASQVLKNLFLLGSARQRPKRGSDLWADLLMIYPWVFRPGTCATSCSRAVWRIFPAGIREHKVGNQAPSCQLPATALLAQKGLLLFVFSRQAEAVKPWPSGGSVDAPGLGHVGVMCWHLTRPVYSCPHGLEA